MVGIKVDRCGDRSGEKAVVMLGPHVAAPRVEGRAAMRVPVVPFGGHAVRSLRTGVFDCTESVYPPKLCLSTHAHEKPYLDITISGHWEEEVGACHRHAGPGTVTVHPAAEPHSDLYSALGARVLNININIRRLLPADGDRFTPECLVCHAETEIAGIAGEIYREFRRSDDASLLSLDGLMLQLLGKLVRARSLRTANAIPMWLLQAAEIIEARFTEPLQLGSVASTVGVHPVHLAREFKRYFHRTIGQRIRQLRMERACRELTCPASPLAEVALEAGFSDQSSFTQAFHRVTGLTPLEFRRLLRRR